MSLNQKYTRYKYIFGQPSYKVLVIVISFFLGIPNLKKASAQIIWAGFKAGVELNQPKLDGIHFSDTVKTVPSFGYSLGAALMFKVKDRYFLQTEYLYSLRTKINKGKIDPLLWDKVTYRYIEIPILFTMQFKVKLGKGKNFKWYAGAGPNVSYLLNANGVIKSGELFENHINSIDYKIIMGDRGPNRDRIDRVYYTGVNKFQFGLNFGAGILLEPAPKHKIIIDLRYSAGQTLFGKRKADYLFPDDYDDNLKFRNRSLKLSVSYLYEYNLNKKERHRGKSTLKSKSK